MRTFAMRSLLTVLLMLLAIGCSDEGTSPQLAAVQASDQSPASPHNTVSIDEVIADSAGWIVIYQDAEGGYGRQLGHSALNKGTTRDLSVTLSRSCVDGETLHALLHIDHGQEGDFEFPGPDEPVLDEASLPIGASFTVNVPDQTLPALEVENQTLSVANQVRLKLVRATSPGRVVIQSRENNAPADIIGELALEVGTLDSADAPVIVTLERDAQQGELLYALLQRRVEGEGEDTYEDEFDLLQNGPLLVLFTVSVEVNEASADAETPDDTLSEDEDTASVGPSQDVSVEDANSASEDSESLEDSGPTIEDATGQDAAQDDSGQPSAEDTSTPEDTPTPDEDAGVEDVQESGDVATSADTASDTGVAEDTELASPDGEGEGT